MNRLNSRFLRPTILLLLWALVAAGGCAVTPTPEGPPPPLTMLTEAEYPAFQDDMNYDNLAVAAANSIRYLKRFPPEDTVDFGGIAVSYQRLRKSLEVFLSFIEKHPDPAALDSFIKSRFQVYRSSGRPDGGRTLFTGYYEPSIRGSLWETPRFRYPVYATPDDLITADLSTFSDRLPKERILGHVQGKRLVPYYTRNDIDQKGALRGKTDIVAWVEDPVALFFLQIQGSGKIFLENGTSRYLLYDGKNGRPYRSIGKLLIENGKILPEEMSMQRIKQYLADHPDEVAAIFDYNPSYVFFRMSEQKPRGCFGFSVTPGRSLALDRRLFPAPGLAYIETRLPVVDGAGDIETWIACRRFALNQDTGGAIRGPGRADLYWGSGGYAETAAGHLQADGDLYILILKET